MDPARPDELRVEGGAPAGGVPLSGSVRLRVRYVECDPMGMAHHSSYLAWLEMARTELLRASGRTYRELEAGGVYLVLTRVDVRYRRPIRYDDVVRVRVTADLSSRVKIRHTYEILLEERGGVAFAGLSGQDATIPSDGVLTVATTELAAVGGDSRPRPLPSWLRAGGDRDG